MYLSTYKAFEHKPPDLIKERIDKDYQAILRSALTSINKVNKMDVETLRTSFGVSMLFITRQLYALKLYGSSHLQTLPGRAQNSFAIFLDLVLSKCGV